MVKQDNTPEKVEASQEEHPTEGKIETKPKVEPQKKPDYMKMAAEEDGIELPESEENVNIREAVKQNEQNENTQKENTQSEIEISERYKGKTPEELVKMIEEKDKYIQSRSTELGTLKSQVEELNKQLAEQSEVRKKIEEIETQNIKQTQQIKGLPEEPEAPNITEADYYDDPTKVINAMNDYLKKLSEWNKNYIHAMISPYYEDRAKKGKEQLYNQLEEKYKDWPVKFDRKAVQEFLNKNPDYFVKYRTNAYEKAFHDMSASEYSQLSKKQQEQMREQIKQELLEETNTQKQAGNIGLSDLQTQGAGSSPAYDEERFEEDAEYRKKVMADMEKRK